MAAAGGTVVADYSEIGVLVVRSANPAFATAGRRGRRGGRRHGRLGTPLDRRDGLELVDSRHQRPPAIPPASRSGGCSGTCHRSTSRRRTRSPPAARHRRRRARQRHLQHPPDLATQIAKDKSASCLGGVVDTSEAAWNPTTSTHGTHVAGTIAAAINGVGVAGVAPGVKVASVKVVDNAGFIYPEAAVCGFMWAAHQGMRLTNNSYFIDPWEFNCRNDARQRPIWQAVQRALRYSQSRGVLHIASAGNSNVDLQHKFIDDGSPGDGSGPRRNGSSTAPASTCPPRRPAWSPCPLRPAAARATTPPTGRAWSTWPRPAATSASPTPTVSTTANAILSTTINTMTRVNGWGYLQGASMASPHTAGVAALASPHPGLTPRRAGLACWSAPRCPALPAGDLRSRPGLDQFKAECRGGSRNSFYGAGEINAFNAVR